MSMNYAAFNQDYSHMAVGTSKGFRIYHTDPFSKAHETQEGNISLIEMLFSTPLVARVLSPRRLVLTNTKRGSTIWELTFPTTILGVKLNRKRLAVVLEDQIYLYDISNMKLVHTMETSPNPRGICALSSSSENCHLAYPLPQKAAPSSYNVPSHVPPNSPAHHLAVTAGHVLLYDALKLQAINVIEAHRSPLSCVVMNADGTRLATASDKGTIIRVFSIPDSQKLFQFRRGSIPARIFSMSFNITSTLLAVSSAHETVHIFSLSNPPPATSGDMAATKVENSVRASRSMSPSSVDDDVYASRQTDETADTSFMGFRAHDGSFAGMLRRTSQNVGKTFAATMGNYLPNSVAEMLEPARDFAWFKLPKVGSASGGGGGGLSGGSGVGGGGGPLKSVVALSANSPQVMVITSEGHFFVFMIDLDKGGEATMVKQHSILNSEYRSGSWSTDD